MLQSIEEVGIEKGIEIGKIKGIEKGIAMGVERTAINLLKSHLMSKNRSLKLPVWIGKNWISWKNR